MPEARIRSLRVRPLRSADLALNMPGILAERSPLAFLGKRISLKDSQGDFDVRTRLYEKLGVADGNGRLLSADGIRALLSGQYLFALRNDSVRASLDQLIAQRQNAYLERYKHDATRADLIAGLYPTSSSDPTGAGIAGGKVWRLNELARLSGRRRDDLAAAYGANYEDGVDRSKVVAQQATKHSNTVTYTQGNVVSTSYKTTPVQMRQGAYDTKIQGNGVSQTVQTPAIDSKPWKTDKDEALTTVYESQKAETTYPVGQGTSLDQTSRTLLTDFAHPSVDNDVRDHRNQVDLRDEFVGSAIYALRVANLRQIWANELAALDAEVLKLQLNYAHTLLVSPIPGIVTAVYKNAGEGVQAGEPLLRVENDDELLLVGSILCRGSVRLDDPVRIEIRNLFEDGVPVTITGASIAAIRGHDADNDEWDVVIACRNPTDGGTKNRRLLPLNYTFDRDDTTITVG